MACYAIALGSNRRHGRYGAPAHIVSSAFVALQSLGSVLSTSRIRSTPALGPAGRGFANAVALVDSDLDPEEMLAALKAIEQDYGRRTGRKWGPRVLDLDIILWSGGTWAGPGPLVPHPEFRKRRFVLEPLVDVAPHWRDPISGASIRHLLFRNRNSHLPLESPQGAW